MPATGLWRYQTCQRPLIKIGGRSSWGAVYTVRMRTLTLFLLSSSASYAATWTVSSSGGADFSRIQDAVTHAAAGDRIEVATGTYEEAIAPMGKDLEFIATGDAVLRPPTSPDAPVFLLAEGETQATVIDGFRFEADSGLGIWLSNSSATLRNLSLVGFGDTYGGAVRVENGTVSIESCDFTAGLSEWGGQVFGQNATITIDSSTFTENASSFSGGAVYAVDSTVEVYDSTFSENDSNLLGGAIALVRGTSWVENSQFSENTSDSGGAIASEDGQLTSKSNTFDDNTATYGAAVYASTCYDPPTDESEEEPVTCSDREAVGTLSFEDELSLYRDNVSLDDGGGVYRDGTHREEDVLHVARFTQTEFNGNFADADGGGIYAKYYVGLRLDRVTFSQNIGESHGGGFYLNNSVESLEINSTLFDRNVAYYGSGGGFYATSNNETTINDCSFIDNRADDGGGAFLFRKGYHLQVSNSIFESNETEHRSGGAIHFEEGGFDDDIILSNNEFRENSSGLHGGAVYSNEARDIILKNNLFESNRTAPNSAGGALMFWDQTAIQVHDNVFIDNGAYYGGAAYAENTWPRVDGDPSNLYTDEWTNNIFRDNRAVYGGALSLLSNPLTDFRNNTMVGNVGTNDASNLHLYATFGTFRNNLIAYSPQGRAIVAADPTTAQEATFWSNAFWNNTAGNWGEIEVEEFDGNIEVSPMLAGSTDEAAPSDNSMVLTSASPLIDAGESSLKDPDGSDSDIGAFGGPNLNDIDSDQDGFTRQYDCDDEDPFVFPGADETWYDGVNQDCSMGSDYDKDGDGAKSSAYGGPDCADDDPAVIDSCVSEETPEDEETAGRCSSLPESRHSSWGALGLMLMLVFRRRASRGVAPLRAGTPQDPHPPTEPASPQHSLR